MSLAERIRQLRQRHFGRRGKSALAESLGLSAAQIERFERGEIPSGELLVRMCEITGEDLQWLLTGKAARGSVVISGARERHRDLLSRIAVTLDDDPLVARQLEAFLDLLKDGRGAQDAAVRALPAPADGALIPIFEWDELEDEPPGAARSVAAHALAPRGSHALARVRALLSEPAHAERTAPRVVCLIEAPCGAGRRRTYVHSPDVARCFPGAFGARIESDALAPMFEPGDYALLAPEAAPTLGRPALCRCAGEPGARIGIWLGHDGEDAVLGRLKDGRQERVARANVRWSLEALFRVALAA